jgi:hypothetical protein
MDVGASDLVVGVMMNLFGLVGLLLAARALDSEMYVFGLSLAAFSYLFILGLIRRHFDAAEAANREVRRG